jgi:hypothetical protein
MRDQIHRFIAQLDEEGIEGLAGYERKLMANSGNVDVFADLQLEGRAALMFSRHGFSVAMRERPDLRIEFGHEVAYVEVKHFRDKGQDRIDEKAMQGSEDLVAIGSTILLEGAEAWQQIANVAIRKADQYIEGAPNLLVIASDSNCISAAILSTAVTIYNEQVSDSEDLRLCRLNGFLLLDQWIWPGNKLEQLIGAGNRSVVFCRTNCATVPLSSDFADAVVSIRHW